MIKTIKTTKKLNLHELIKYVWENSGKLFVNEKTLSFYTEDNKKLAFEESGDVSSHNWFDPDDLFKIETEIDITDDMVFERCIVLIKNGAIYTPFNISVRHIKEIYKAPKSIYIQVNGKLELIWESED